MDRAEKAKQTTAGHGEKETTVRACYLKSLLARFTDSRSVTVTKGHDRDEPGVLFAYLERLTHVISKSRTDFSTYGSHI